MQNKTFLQTIGTILNTSSQTFMLIALVSLFVVPIVIAQNLVPVVSNSENQLTAIRIRDNVVTNNIVSTEIPVDSAEAYNSNVNQHSITNDNVLGITDSRDIKPFITENTQAISLLTGISSYSVEEYNLDISYKKVFNKTLLYKIKNTSDLDMIFSLNVETLGDANAKSNLSKVLYVDSNAFDIGSSSFPADLSLTPNQEVSISLASSKTSPTNISISLKLQN